MFAKKGDHEESVTKMFNFLQAEFHLKGEYNPALKKKKKNKKKKAGKGQEKYVLVHVKLCVQLESYISMQDILLSIFIIKKDKDTIHLFLVVVAMAAGHWSGKVYIQY